MLSLKQRSEIVIVAITALFLSIIYLWEIPKLSYNSLFMNPDSDTVLYTLDWQAYSIIYEPGNFFHIPMGYPKKYNLARQDQFFGALLLYLPIRYLTDNPVFALNLTTILLFTLCLLCTYLYARHLRFNPLISFGVSMVYAFYSFHATNIPRTQLHTIYFLPLSLLSMEIFLEKNKRIFLFVSGILYGMQIISCWYYGFFLAPFIILYLFIREKQEKNKIGKILKDFLLFSLSVFIITAPFAYPYYLNYKQTPIFYINLDKAIERSLSLRDLFNPSPFLKTFSLYSKILKPKIPFEEHTAYIGFMPYLLLLIILPLFISLWKKNEIDRDLRKFVFLFLFLLIISFVIASGPGKIWNNQFIPLPYYFLYKFIPGYKSIRSPGRANIMLVFCILFLIGIVSEVCFRKMKLKHKTKFIISILILFISFYEILPMKFKLLRHPLEKELPGVYKTLKNSNNEIVLLDLYPYSHKITIPDPKTNNLTNRVSMKPSKCLYFAVFHRKKLVNMYTAYPDSDYIEIEKAVDDFPSALSLKEIIKRKYITHVIIHTENLGYEEDKIFLSDKARKELIKFVEDNPELKLLGIYDSKDYLIQIIR
ncbi:MAG: hypothetical protein JXA60_00915 [Candidatus Coatesbacteria bacterium]|nr:hypothetical protein [Candidatus Coatesbacteria bacterium]